MIKPENNFDKIFSDKFKNAEIAPPEEIWTAIEAKLPLKQAEKRVIPIWYYFAGSVAAILAIVLFLNQNVTTPTETTISNTDVEQTKTQDNNNSNKRIPSADKPAITNNETERSQDEINPAHNSKNDPTSSFRKKQPLLSEGNRLTQINYSKEKSAEDSSKKTELLKRNINPLFIVTKDIIPFQDPITATTPKITLTQSKLELNNPVLIEKEELKNDFSASNRFSISANAAALYYDNVGTGSAISSEISSETGELNSLSYGISIGYLLTEKLKIRSGLSQVNLTGNINKASYSSIVSSSVVNQDFPLTDFPSDGNTDANGNFISQFVSIDQKFNFIEIPAELEYFLVKRKVGISLIGGFSSLIANKNKINISSEARNISEGEVTNINKISFTANLGLGLNYSLTPQLQLNFEPLVKYQLNTFNKVPEYRPYYFGLYSGISYKF